MTILKLADCRKARQSDYPETLLKFLVYGRVSSQDFEMEKYQATRGEMIAETRGSSSLVGFTYIQKRSQVNDEVNAKQLESWVGSPRLILHSQFL